MNFLLTWIRWGLAALLYFYNAKVKRGRAGGSGAAGKPFFLPPHGLVAACYAERAWRGRGESRAKGGGEGSERVGGGAHTRRQLPRNEGKGGSPGAGVRSAGCPSVEEGAWPTGRPASSVHGARQKALRRTPHALERDRGSAWGLRARACDKRQEKVRQKGKKGRRSPSPPSSPKLSQARTGLASSWHAVPASRPLPLGCLRWASRSRGREPGWTEALGKGARALPPRRHRSPSM